MATEKQATYLAYLWVSKDTDGLTAPASGWESLDNRAASEWIDTLRDRPRKTAGSGSAAGLEAGMYRTASGEIYRVQPSRETGRLYAKRMDWTGVPGDKPRFVYAAGAVYSLTPTDRMTVADAQAWGVETGVCCVCGAFLTDAKSVANGIGPVCAGKV